MDINICYPSKYVGAADLQGQDVTVSIASVKMEAMRTDNGSDEQKVIIYFAGMGKGMILNKTNAKIVTGMFGSETDDWAGQTITLYAGDTRRKDGTPCKGLMVRHLPPVAAPTTTPVVQPLMVAPVPAAPAPVTPATAAPVSF